jgi:cbb3-type cytochrome oxidase subunit 1
MQPFWAVRLLGGTLMFAGILLFFWNLVATFVGRSEARIIHEAQSC